MKITTLLAIAVFLIVHVGTAQVDHLVPVTMQRNELYQSYERTLIEKLLPGLVDRPLVAYLYVPSLMGTEHAFEIRKGRTGYLFVFREAEKSIWYSRGEPEKKLHDRWLPC